MRAEEINRLGGLVFQRIEEGFDRYEHEIMTGTSEQLKEQVMKYIHHNGWESSFVDFYYGKLQKEEQIRIQEVVPKGWIPLLEQYETNTEVYYPLTQELFELTWLLTSKEYLFSTFYFCKEPCTIWGNYNNTLVRFWTT